MAEPFQSQLHNKFSLLCNFSLVVVFFFSLVLKMGVLSEGLEDSYLLSDELKAVFTFDTAGITVALIVTLLASVLVAAAMAVYQVYTSTRAAARAAAAEREASIARGRLSQPPSHNWELRQGNRFCVFLSHFKVEAGSDARCLSNLIKRMTGCAAYLDSNDLVDLRTLFNEGDRSFLNFLRTRTNTVQVQYSFSPPSRRRSQVGRPRHPRHEGRLDEAVVPAGDVGGGVEPGSHRAPSGGWRKLDSGRCTHTAE